MKCPNLKTSITKKVENLRYQCGFCNISGRKNDMKNPKFGIEVEFYIVDQKGFPVLNSNSIIKNKCLELDSNLSISQELSSFQIEINPGPWALNISGLYDCLHVLQHHYEVLVSTVENCGWKLCESLMPSCIRQDIINHQDYFTKNPRFNASSNYFSQREEIVLQNSSSILSFPGETMVGCINEIHIHAQLSNDDQTIHLFNYLNEDGLFLTKHFNQPIKINDNVFGDIDSLKLFKLANGEWNNNKSIYRVGKIPHRISSYKEYVNVLKSFKKIPLSSNETLDLESTVFFWTRLRGRQGDLRVEFRPMEMGENWIERVKYLYKVVKEFEINNLCVFSQLHSSIKRKEELT